MKILGVQTVGPHEVKEGKGHNLLTLLYTIQKHSQFYSIVFTEHVTDRL